MGGFSFIHIVVLALVAVALLGGGRFSALMTDAAKGVKNFKKGMSEDDEDDVRPAARLQKQPPLEPNVDRVPQPMPDDRPAA